MSIAHHPIFKAALELAKRAHHDDEVTEIQIVVRVRGQGSFIMRQTDGNAHTATVIREGEKSRHEINEIEPFGDGRPAR